jgi:NhaA family Na+:H+ antiporter
MPERPRRAALAISRATRGVALALVEPVQAFIRLETSSGIVLLVATVTALIWANSPWDDEYFDLWHSVISLDLSFLTLEEDLQHWVNDGLMAVFFFVVGLEIKRELLHGELNSPRKASLPMAAAIGGMVAPAAIYAAFNAGGEGAEGWGIPMATDIAFALGVLALVGRGIPSQLRVFLLALAIVDDVGAILVIAVFYTENLDATALGVAGLLIIAIVFMQRGGIRAINPYWIVGIAFWVAVYESGIHATIAGVIMGLLTPSKAFIEHHEYAVRAKSLLDDFSEAVDRGDEDRIEAAIGELERITALAQSPLERLENTIHPWSSFVIVPIFALANAGIVISGDVVSDAVSSPVSHGIFAGLVVGKLWGILLMSWLAVRLRIAELPVGLTWNHIIGVALLGGTGFTVSLFITDLAFAGEEPLADAKISVLFASAVAAAIGFTFLRLFGRSRPGGGAEVSIPS